MVLHKRRHNIILYKPLLYNNRRSNFPANVCADFEPRNRRVHVCLHLRFVYLLVKYIYVCIYVCVSMTNW